jgi:TfoX/Sxy family transcriptional regulator of competence genes
MWLTLKAIYWKLVHLGHNMASDLDYVQYVVDQIKTNGTVTYKKMFGEYLIYLNSKPVVMVCDNTAFVKIIDCIKPLMENAETGFPYEGAKEHYIINIDDSEYLSNVINILEENVSIPKKKKK